MIRRLTWSDKFASYKETHISQLQRFSVMLREVDRFELQFIESLGLNNMCRLAAKNTKTRNTRHLDMELLRAMKDIIETNRASLQAIVAHIQ